MSICFTLFQIKYLYTFVLFSFSADILHVYDVQITCDEYLEQFALVFSPVLQHALEIPLFANDTHRASALANHVLWRGLLDMNTCCHHQYSYFIIMGCHSNRNTCDNLSTKLTESI